MMVGCSPGELLGRSEFMYHDDERYNALKHLNQKPKVFSRTFVYSYKTSTLGTILVPTFISYCLGSNTLHTSKQSFYKDSKGDTLRHHTYI